MWPLAVPFRQPDYPVGDTSERGRRDTRERHAKRGRTGCRQTYKDSLAGAHVAEDAFTQPLDFIAFEHQQCGLKDASGIGAGTRAVQNAVLVLGKIAASVAAGQTPAEAPPIALCRSRPRL